MIYSSVSTRRRSDVDTTLFERQRRCYNFETTRGYWKVHIPVQEVPTNILTNQYGLVSICFEINKLCFSNQKASGMTRYHDYYKIFKTISKLEF